MKQPTVLCCGPHLFELLQGLLGAEDKLQGHHLAVAAGSTAGAVHVVRHLLQSGGGDHPRVPQGRDDLVLQQPADLQRTGEAQELGEKHSGICNQRKDELRVVYLYIVLCILQIVYCIVYCLLYCIWNGTLYILYPLCNVLHSVLYLLCILLSYCSFEQLSK